MKNQILVTGGMGYNGPRACISVLQTGHQALILDNLSNSNVTAGTYN